MGGNRQSSDWSALGRQEVGEKHRTPFVTRNIRSKSKVRDNKEMCAEMPPHRVGEVAHREEAERCRSGFSREGDTICAEVITEMRGADFIVFRIN